MKKMTNVKPKMQVTKNDEYPRHDGNKPKTISAVRKVKCSRCGGGGRMPFRIDGGRCWGCFSSGTVNNSYRKWIFPQTWNGKDCTQWLLERQANLDEKRAKKQAEIKAKTMTRVLHARKINDDKLVDLIGLTVEELSSELSWNNFVTDVCAKANNFQLTQGQLNALAKSYRKHTDRQQQKQAKIDSMVEVPTGRNDITGTIVSVKIAETEFGTTAKMLVEVDGFKIFGSVPKSIWINEESLRELVGKTVQFSATLQPKELGFGFFSRPTKAKLI